MSNALQLVRSLNFACLLIACLVPSANAEPLVLVGGAIVDADFVSATDSGMLTFRVVGENRAVSLEQIVSWSTVSPNHQRSEIILVDGSRIVLADSWTGTPSWQLEAEAVTATTVGFGEILVSRELVRAIVTNAPRGIVPRTRFIDQQVLAPRAAVGLLMSNGDRWDGDHIASIGKRGDQYFLAISTSPEARPLEAATRQLAAVVLNALPKVDEWPTQLWIGTRGGSLLRGQSLAAGTESLRVRLSCGLELAGKGSEVSYLRSSAARLEYLSDRDDARYRHEPYLDLVWPFARDRNVLTGPLQVTGQIHAKGLGVTTATRLAYALDRPPSDAKFQRFVASAAIDAAAGKRGSVVFRVYLQADGAWNKAYESDVVRGGDPPTPVLVELGEATQLALVTDFADRGDELDYANWLDARLE